MSLRSLDPCDFAARCSDMKCSKCPLKRRPVAEKKAKNYNTDIEAILFLIALIFFIKWLLT